ncbi:uncharacterized protein LOC111094020 isoform X2 [Canis lupus familiaris]|uniref:uncharacterized protein LOC111094020 isoform X2 n=1 Tax=Canis lupus familiaris TaxID=9615 RepID=UPI0018F2C7AF|nr:uncharacterized protein LOC111094020 isoform X2 [Canis lupus familiaris]XP_038319077.1 uncharacterized protein LOC111094020 isoform X2 [Canis lupus familiaris]XP_038439888.1 uncharacterized protein LOC111094020 isoform X2 [Canis lupus familiaris]
MLCPSRVSYGSASRPPALGFRLTEKLLSGTLEQREKRAWQSPNWLLELDVTHITCHLPLAKSGRMAKPNMIRKRNSYSPLSRRRRASGVLARSQCGRSQEKTLVIARQPAVKVGEHQDCSLETRCPEMGAKGRASAGLFCHRLQPPECLPTTPPLK